MMVSELGSDFVFGLQDPVPLYRDNGDLWVESLGDDGAQPQFHGVLSGIDENSMVLRMMIMATGTNHLLQHRLWVVLMDSAIGRPGELRMLNLNTIKFYGGLQLMVLKWHDLKNREVSAKPIIHNRLGWKFDVFHAMGCYWAAEKGLYRSQQEIDKGMQYSMFLELKRVAQQSASKKIQTVMQKSLPPDTPLAVVKSITGKSVRYAAVTETYGHGDVSGPQGATRTNHSIGNTGDVYIRKMHPQHGLVALQARSGYTNVKGKDVLPTLNAIGYENRDAVTRFVNCLFVINIPEFLPKGTLRPIIHTVTASMILFHKDVIHDCEVDNVVTQHMIKCARETMITDTRAQNGRVEDILCLWSDDVKEHLHKNRFDDMKVVPEMNSIATGINSLLTMTSKLVATDVQRTIEHKDLLSKFLMQQSTMNHMSQQIQQVTVENQQLKRKLAFVRTPPPIIREGMNHGIDNDTSKKFAPKILYDRQYSETNNTNTTEDTIGIHSITSTNKDSTIIKDSGINSNVQKNKKEKLNELIFDLAEQNRLSAADFTKCMILSSDVDEMSRLTYCLELVMVATSLEERNALVDAPNQMKRWDAANMLMTKASYTLLVYEGNCNDGTRMDTAFKNNNKKEHEKYNPLGVRIRTLKVKIIEKMGLDKREKNTVKKRNLCCLENVTNVQTSVLKYFANNTTKKNNK